MVLAFLRHSKTLSRYRLWKLFSSHLQGLWLELVDLKNKYIFNKSNEIHVYSHKIPRPYNTGIINSMFQSIDLKMWQISKKSRHFSSILVELCQACRICRQILYLYLFRMVCVYNNQWLHFHSYRGSKWTTNDILFPAVQTRRYCSICNLY